MRESDVTGLLRRYARTLESSFALNAVDVAKHISEETQVVNPRIASRNIRRAVTILVAALIGFGSLGFAANASIPGEALYPVDRAIEQGLQTLGLSTPEGRVTERVSEAEVLLNRGAPLMALETVLGTVREDMPLLSQEEASRATEDILRITERVTDDAGLASDSQPVNDILGLLEDVDESGVSMPPQERGSSNPLWPDESG